MLIKCLYVESIYKQKMGIFARNNNIWIKLLFQFIFGQRFHFRKERETNDGRQDKEFNELKLKNKQKKVKCKKNKSKWRHQDGHHKK